MRLKVFTCDRQRSRTVALCCPCWRPVESLGDSEKLEAHHMWEQTAQRKSITCSFLLFIICNTLTFIRRFEQFLLVIYSDLFRLRLGVQVDPTWVSLIVLPALPDIQFFFLLKRQLTHLSICLPIQSHFHLPEGEELLMALWLIATAKVRWLTADANSEVTESESDSQCPYVLTSLRREHFVQKRKPSHIDH